MKRRRKAESTGTHALTTLPVPTLAKPRRNYARWRALSLSLVYIVFAVHIIHWKLAGKTLAPLELNEVMYTLELGIITAGFLFMCFLVAGTMIFGRFFCSWACHIMVLQDLCAWILRKVRIRQKPIRSRLLLWVPAATAFYMFIWPQILRAWQSRAFPEFHLQTDAQGWASFFTDNYWRNLPSAPIIILTFLVCGFLIVYLLGSRTFCTYVCPYGAVFGLADRLAPGRIRVNKDACRQCGTCTAACTSGVRVHEEINRHGMIVNPSCLKDLDCVAACPQSALSYRFGKPSLFKSIASGGRFGSLPYDFSVREELLIILVFLAVLLSFRGLYSRIPFLLSLALGGIIGYLTVVTVRTVRLPNVRLATVQLKHLGGLTQAGRVYGLFMVVLAAFVGHSGFVRYHEFFGLLRTEAAEHAIDEDTQKASAEVAYAHLIAADRWGLIGNPRVEQALASVSLRLGHSADAESYAAHLLKRDPYNTLARLWLGQALASQNRATDAEQQFRAIVRQCSGLAHPPPALGRAHQALAGLLARRSEFSAAERELRQAAELQPDQAAVQAEWGSVLAEAGRLEEAITALRQAVRLDPWLGSAHYNLGTILAHLGRFDEAIANYERALAAGADDAEVHNNLGYALLRTGHLGESRQHLERAITLDEQNADAHFNLARLLAIQGFDQDANTHLQTAAALDPRYARLLQMQLSE